MAKLRYKDGEVWKSIAPSQDEFDELKIQTETQATHNKLKVAKVEKELNDYKNTMSTVNVNQEAKQKVSGYGSVSLPKNSANGQVSVSVFGNTRTNLVPLFDSVEWSFDSEVTINSPTKVTINATSRYKGMVVLKKLKVGTTCIISCKQNMGRFEITHKDINNTTITKDSSTSNSFQFTVPINTVTTSIRLDNNTITDTSIIFENVLLEEGTEVKHFIANTQSTVGAKRIKSVGKNLVDITKAEYYGDGLGKDTYKKDGETITITRMSSGSHEGFCLSLDVTPNKKHTISWDMISLKGSNVSYVLGISNEDLRGIHPHSFDNTYEINSSYKLGVGSASFTPTTEKVYMFSRVGGDSRGIEVKDVMVELNDINSTYESYKENSKYILDKKDNEVVKLRSLPNGIADEITKDGKLITRISEEVEINGTESWRLWRTVGETTGFYAGENVIPNAIAPSIHECTINGDKFSGEKYSEIFATMPPYTTTIYDKKNATHGIFIVLPTSVAGTVEQLNTWLATNKPKFIYAIPQEVKTIQTSGNLISYPSGTITVEDVVADASVYTDKFTILNTDLPIKSVDKLIKYDFQTGIQTSLDVSKVVVNVDKQSFTHVDLVDGDMVFVDYFYTTGGTQPKTTVEYKDSRYTVKDTVNGKFYEWDIISNNGILEVKLVEVI